MHNHIYIYMVMHTYLCVYTYTCVYIDIHTVMYDVGLGVAGDRRQRMFFGMLLSCSVCLSCVFTGII